MRGFLGKNIEAHMAMAKARTSESWQVTDTQATFNGCGKVPYICVHMTPKYLTPLMFSGISVKIRFIT